MSGSRVDRLLRIWRTTLCVYWWIGGAILALFPAAGLDGSAQMVALGCVAACLAGATETVHRASSRLSRECRSELGMEDAS